MTLKDSGRTRETAPRYLDSGTPTSGRLTYEDYCNLPPGQQYELVEGDLRMTPSPGILHQEVSKRLMWLFLEQVEKREIGRVYCAPTDVVLGEHTVVQPDLVCVLREHQELIGEAYIKGPPDLVVEILSQSTQAWDRSTKRRLYSQSGVREYWIVDPQVKTIEVTSHDGSQLRTVCVYNVDTTLASPLIPDVTIDLGWLFRP